MKKILAISLVSLLILTVMLTWPLSTEPVAAQVYSSGSWLYYGMQSAQNSSSELAGSPTIGRESVGTPLQPSWNITFSAPWQLSGYGWIVNLTVPATTYHVSSSYSYEFIGWVNTTVTMTVDGYGWLFLNATGDVDCYTSNNNTGSYWISPSPMAGTKAADPGTHPSPGPDGVAGTADDGFGDGTTDTRGSSILYLKTTVTTYYASQATGWQWTFLFSYDWTAVWTTGVAYDIVNEPTSGINGVSSRQEGHPWEFYAGEDNPGKGPVPHGHPKWNAYVTYASAWSQHNIGTQMGDLDLLVGETQKLVREDVVIADINCDELVDIGDIVLCAIAFGSKDSNFGSNGVPDGPPPGGDDKIDPDPNWNPAGDTSPALGEIDIGDIVRIAIEFGKELAP